MNESKHKKRQAKKWKLAGLKYLLSIKPKSYLTAISEQQYHIDVKHSWTTQHRVVLESVNRMLE